MEITKSTIKALASDTRLEMLKLLAQRRKIPADIAKLMKLAPSTVNEHLKILEQEGLVQRKETGHKWIYFEVTDKGRSLVRPSSPIQFVLILGVGAMMMLVGGFRSFPEAPQNLMAPVVSRSEGMLGEAAPQAAAEVALATPVDWFMVFVLIVGIILAAIGVYNIWKIGKK